MAITKKGEEYSVSKSGDDIQAMAKAIAATRTKKPAPEQPSNMTREEWILSMQPASTKALIEKHKDPSYIADNSRDLPEGTLANPHATSRDELVAMRRVDPIEVSHVEAIRRRPKNSQFQSTESATDNETRDSAIHHFEVSGHAEPTQKELESLTRLVNLDAVPQPTPEAVWIELTWYEALKHWAKGGKVEQRSKDNNLTWGIWK